MLSSKGFDLWADGYDKAVGISDDDGTYPFAGYRDILGEIYRRIMESGAKRVLDIGFGTGTLSKKLYDMGCEISGQDFSARMIEIAGEKMPGANLFQGDFADGIVPPLADQTYDAVVATYSLHHLTDDQKISFIRALTDLLNPGGHLYIGDVAFETRAGLEKCREMCADDWDEDEIYFAFDEIKRHFPSMEFMPFSFCAGLMTIQK